MTLSDLAPTSVLLAEFLHMLSNRGTPQYSILQLAQTRSQCPTHATALKLRQDARMVTVGDAALPPIPWSGEPVVERGTVVSDSTAVATHFSWRAARPRSAWPRCGRALTP